MPRRQELLKRFVRNDATLFCKKVYLFNLHKSIALLYESGTMATQLSDRRSAALEVSNMAPYEQYERALQQVAICEHRLARTHKALAAGRVDKEALKQAMAACSEASRELAWWASEYAEWHQAAPDVTIAP